MRSTIPLAAALLLVPAAPALAAPPPNDDRVDAERLQLPATASGTVREATLEPNELGSGCDTIDSSVWYRFSAPARGAAVLQLDAGGDLDATVDVFRRQRSELTPVNCDSTDRRGSVTLQLDDLDGEYLVRVGRRFDSDPGGFDLRLLVPSPPARPPGKPLRGRGARDSVDGLANPSDAYSVALRAGVPYRFSLSAKECTRLTIFAPGGGFNDPQRSLRCGGYRLYTPERSGRYPLLVEAGRARGRQRYRLAVGRARGDDTTPGIFIRNNARVRGRVNGRLDSVDLYRFDVTRRSSLNLRVSGGPRLTLVKPGGKRLATNTSAIRRNVGAGRYVVAVRGKGRYKLRRVSKTITRSNVLFNGRRKAFAGPGTSATLSLNVSPNVNGRSVILLEKFDPLEGWQFLRRARPRVVGGRAALTFAPRTIGRYRATAQFRGSKLASPSEAGRAKLVVRAPLRD